MRPCFCVALVERSVSRFSSTPLRRGTAIETVIALGFLAAARTIKDLSGSSQVPAENKKESEQTCPF
jgi:hypothetical protein